MTNEKEESDAVPDSGVDSNIAYRINESPPIHVTLFVALQHLMICFASTATLSAIISDVLCVGMDHPVRSTMFSTALCMSGVNTVLQSLFGSRLPVFQGPSFTFIGPLLALAADPTWVCHDAAALKTNGTLVNTSVEEKLQQMSGSLMAASAVEVVIGVLGVVGPLMRFVGPITVAPTIALIGLSLYPIPVDYSRPCPPMAIVSAVLVVVFSLYLPNVYIPVGCGHRKTRLPIFQVLPVLLSISLVWCGAAVLTACGVFTDDPDSAGYLARTDAKAAIVRSTPWFLFSYPGQFGMPSFNVAAFVGFTAAVLSSVVESVGDYLAAARSCQVPPPPRHAVSRGILMEGLGSVLSGAHGAGHATATYSGNIALLSLCRTASRSVLVVAGIILVLISFLGKFAAAFSTVPEPILGGVSLVVLGILVAIGISALKHADLHSTRNLIIIGVAIFVGLVLPDFVKKFPETVETGNTQADQVIRVLLGTPMILGGVVACLLDNTVKGGFEERGLHEWSGQTSKADDKDNIAEDTEMAHILGNLQAEEKIYSWSVYPRFARKFAFLSHLPFMPPGPNALREVSMSVSSAENA